MRLLRGMGVDAYQGWLFSRAVPVRDFHALLRDPLDQVSFPVVRLAPDPQEGQAVAIRAAPHGQSVRSDAQQLGCLLRRQ